MSLFSKLIPCLVLVAAFGCQASRRAEVAGTASLDGQPIEEGTISFLPTGNVADMPTWSKILAGRYMIPKKTGPMIGSNRVEIRWPRKTGRMVPTEPAVEEISESIPTRYNNQSELQVEIKLGKNQFDFNLYSESQRKP